MLKKSFLSVILAWSTLSFCYADTVETPSHVEKPLPTSYLPVVINETFQTILNRMSAAKDAIDKRQQELLHLRYDLSNTPSATAKMSNGKSVQEGVRVKLAQGTTWDMLAKNESR